MLDIISEGIKPAEWLAGSDQYECFNAIRSFSLVNLTFLKFSDTYPESHIILNAMIS
jgi:hypothetical protein